MNFFLGIKIRTPQGGVDVRRVARTFAPGKPAPPGGLAQPAQAGRPAKSGQSGSVRLAHKHLKPVQGGVSLQRQSDVRQPSLRSGRQRLAMVAGVIGRTESAAFLMRL